MLYPMAALVALTFVVVLINFIWRVHSVKQRQVSPKYYLIMQGQTPPERIIQGTRHFANLFEMPVLYYVVGVLAITLQLESMLLIALGWLYVVIRLVHAVIHMSYNGLWHRIIVFWLGCLCLLAMWIVLLVSYRA